MALHPMQQLAMLGRFHIANAWSESHAMAWIEKREQLELQLLDLPHLAEAVRSTRREPVEGKPNFFRHDPIPGLRLANACEASANALYSLTEVAAAFGGTATRNTGNAYPSSFNQLVKKLVEAEPGDPDLRAALGDLRWYRRVRELRTEWSHHSSIFVGGGAGSAPVLVVHAFRRGGDRVELPEKTTFTVEEMAAWIRGALGATDRFAEHLVNRFMVPRLKAMRDATFPYIDFDADGSPGMDPSTGRPLVRQWTVAELLRRAGVNPDE